jgi:GT2 family glycosyltransferase
VNRTLPKGQARSTAVVVDHNGAADTALCASSLLRSRTRPGLVVVDNGSTGKDVGEAISGHPDAELIRSPENLGFGRGNNLGIVKALSRSDCEFVLLLNNDATVEPGTLEKLERALDEHPGAGIATPRILFMEHPDRLWYGGGEVDWRKGSARVPGYLGPADAAGALEPRDVGFASGCAMLVRREVVEHVGCFDRRYFMYEEDVELCLRTMEKGWTIRYVPEAVVYHKVQASAREKEEVFHPLTSPGNPRLAFNMFHLTKNRLLNMSSHARGRAALQFVCFFPAFLLVKCAQFAAKGRWDGVRAVLKGIAAFLSEAGRPREDEHCADVSPGGRFEPGGRAW